MLRTPATAQPNGKSVRIAEPKLYYLSKSNANFPSLKSVECSIAEIASTLGDLEAKYRQLSHQAGPGARLVCDLSHNNMTCEHLQYATQLLIASPVQLFALDLSWNRIFAPTWDEVLPVVKQLLTKATYVDLAGNYLPALDPEHLELKDMHIVYTIYHQCNSVIWTLPQGCKQQW